MAVEHDAWMERVFGVHLTSVPAGSPAASGPDDLAADGPVSDGPAADGSAAAGLGHAASPRSAARRHAPARPVPRAGVGPAQASRAGDLVRSMPPADRARVVDLLNKASDGERPYLTKALASGHPAAEVLAFHARIAGKPHAWMEDNLHLVGNTHGKGIKQQWENSCVPTMVEAMRGELDPVYALRMHDQNPNLTEADDADGARLNPRLAAMQKRELMDAGSDASNRNAPRPHPGESDADIMGHLYGATGIRFQHKATGFWEEPAAQVIKELKTTPKLHQALEDVKASLKAGIPVPLAIVKVLSAGGMKVPVGTHAMLFVGADPGPPARYSIHDPQSGTTMVVPEEDMRNGDFHVGSPGSMFLEGIYQPVARR